MDLKSDNPFWLLKNGLLQSYLFLENDLTCDVAILGGGITGALIAESLVSAGLECVVLDRTSEPGARPQQQLFCNTRSTRTWWI